jgi:hypothetical protein
VHLQAICQLPQLTLLTSLTPSLEPLLLNPERPHLGCDLAQLKPKASLAGMDVAVLSPEHLASLAQFTALRQLNLRCVYRVRGQWFACFAVLSAVVTVSVTVYVSLTTWGCLSGMHAACLSAEAATPQMRDARGQWGPWGCLSGMRTAGLRAETTVINQSIIVTSVEKK